MGEREGMSSFSQWLETTRWQAFGHEFSPAGVAAAGICLLAGFFVSGILQSQRVRKIFVRLGIDAKLVSFATAALGLMIFFAGVGGALVLLGLPISWEAAIPGVGLSLAEILRVLILLAVVIWLSGSLKHFLFNRFLSGSGLNRSLQHTIAQIFGYVILIFGSILTLQNAGINLSALAVFAGALGVGLGIGLQNVTSNFLSGIILLLERPVEIGDRVEVGDVAGQIRQIRARSTTVLTNDNIAIIVPNSKFIEDTVINWTHNDPRVRFRISVGVAYGSDIEKVREVLLQVAAEHPQSLNDPPPVVFFDNFGESSLDFELAVWSAEMSYRPRRFRSDLRFAIDKKFREHGIEIPFPQRDLHLRSVPEKSMTPEMG